MLKMISLAEDLAYAQMKSVFMQAHKNPRLHGGWWWALCGLRKIASFSGFL
jgi:hypothetical protein